MQPIKLMFAMMESGSREREKCGAAEEEEERAL
jgi:hypothetical protein